MIKKFYYSVFCLVFLLLLPIGQAAWAQVTGTSISGKVTDEKGIGLPGVTVVVRNESTGFQTNTLSNTEGSYSFKQLPLGKPYELKASYIGHATQVQNNFALNLGDQLVVNFIMRQAAIDLEEVVVTTSSLSSRIDRAGGSTFIRA